LRSRALAPLGVLALLALSSCAPRLRYVADLDPIRYLPEELQLYATATGAEAGRIAKALLDPADLGPVLEATRRVERLALGSDGAGKAWAAASGTFPAKRANAALVLDAAWKREGPGFVRAADGTRLAFADERLALAATASLDPVLAHLEAPAAFPFPESLLGLWSADLALWVRDASSLAARVAGDAEAVEGLPPFTLAAGFSADATGALSGTLAFGFADERSARVYEAVARLSLYALARAFFEEAEGDTLLSLAQWRREGSQVRATLPPLAGPSFDAALRRAVVAFE